MTLHRPPKLVAELFPRLAADKIDQHVPRHPLGIVGLFIDRRPFVAQNTDEQYLHLGATSRSMGVFVGGVLYTPSAWVMGLGSPVARVRAGVEAATFPPACFRVIMTT